MNYISFDMGSESMAAFCQLKNDPEGFNINLQEYAQELLGNISESDIDYLWIDKNRERVKSSRLRTLISLENRRQPAILSKQHAKLNFFDSKGNVSKKDGKEIHRESLFGFFYKKGQSLSRVVIPNPKIPFQEGAGKVIPEIESTEKGWTRVRHEPETLIHHMMVQIINNFVLKSTKLRNKKLGKDSHLILTIPNVYSLTHAQSIKKFIKECVNIGSVETLYESDAVAYYTLDQKNKYHEVDEFIQDMRNLKNIDGYQILAIDIGHGTTDLSLIEITEPKADDLDGLINEEEKRRRFFVKARTGKSEGGSRLNYILAQYYNSRLEDLLNREEFSEFKLSFNFLKVLKGVKFAEQPGIIGSLEDLINAVKKSMNVHYEVLLNEKEQRRYIDSIIQLWIDATLSGWTENDKKEKKGLCDRFKSEFRQAFILKKLPGSFKCFFIDILPNFVVSRLFPDMGRIVMLKKNIRKYVKSNVEETLEQLNDMALARENIDPYKKSKTIFDKKHTFAVIAGQASQFIPIQKAIRRELNRLNIPTNYRLFLKGEDAKEACCRGAVVYKQSGQEWGNPAEIHGTYGFLNAVKSLGDVYCVLDTRELNDRVTVHHEFDFPSTYWLFFTPRAYYTINNHNHPTFFDGTTALIESFTDTKSFDVSFDQDTLSIIVNNKSGFKIATYGDINESIYPKVWPVYLEPEKE